MKKMIPMTMIPGASAFIASVRPRAERGRADHTTAGRHKHQQERAPHFAEQPAVFQPGVVELESLPVAVCPGAPRTTP